MSASRMGLVRPSPFLMPDLTDSMVEAMAWFPITSLTMFMAWIRGTVLRSRVPRVRLKRLTSILRKMDPRSGSFSNRASQLSLPFSVRR